MGGGAPRRNSRGMPKASLDPDLALALFVGPTLLDASLDIEDLSATRLHNAELTLSESFKFPRAGQRESISINGSRLFIWFFRHQPGKGLKQSF